MIKALVRVLLGILENGGLEFRITNKGRWYENWNEC